MADSPYGPAGSPDSMGHRYPPGYQAPREGLPTAAKVAIGCAAAAFVVLVIGALLLFLAGHFVSKQIGGLEAHEQATETFDRLAKQYPFTPPADGIVDARQAWTFFAVTDEVWEEIAVYAEELNELGERMREGEEEPGFGDVMSGVQAMGKIFRARLALADALEGYRLSNAEYVWTGRSLVDAYGALTDPEVALRDVPRANLELARRHQYQLAELAGDEELGKGMVLFLIGMLDSPEGVAGTMDSDSAEAEPR